MSRESTAPAGTASLDDEIEGYLKHLRWALAGLPAEDRDEIVRETRSHLFDRCAGPRPRPFAEVARELGTAEEYGRRFLANYNLSVALGSGSAPRMLRAAAMFLGRGLWATAGFFVFVVLYIVTAGFALVAGLKLVIPDQVGLWTSTARPLFVLGAIATPNDPTLREHLGGWIVPLCLAAATLLYWGTTALLRRFLRTLRK